MGKSKDNFVRLATIAAAHGIKGDVKLVVFTADPFGLSSYGKLFDENGRSFEIDHIRKTGNAVIAHFSGIDDRNSAEALNGIALYVDRQRLPDDLEEDEFYQTDLIGLLVRDETGQVIGKVNAVFDFGGGDILELKIEGEGLKLIPFSKAAVPEIDIGEGFISIDRLAAGLVDDDLNSAHEEEQ
ncbi:ribosome maturation factor RimM [Bartonella sp. M0177]|uniref:ribosome maturation factor RimM n=1 Tax=Bartonella sp. M0177 TaxID=2750940 RepID=UPI0018DD193E|nr:ribosome maturation factor RimM [Bartonella sp. M0177]MBI0004365.1 ribosome maturation factor RimM [Bartonella sp. M0177]